MNALHIELGALIIAISAVFLAGIIRGYSGFGFAMVAVTSMSLVLAPSLVVPIVLILEVLASLRLLPQAWKDIDWLSLRWLLIGSFLGIPFGVSLLAAIPPARMRMSISLLVLIAAILLRYGFAWKRMPGKILILLTGLASGMLNGAAAIGGPPVILFYLSSPAGVTVSRASIVAYFLVIDTLCLVMAAFQGLTTTNTLYLTAFCLIPLLAGIAIGSRMFFKVDPLSFRRHVLILLILLSVAGLFRSVFSSVL